MWRYEISWQHASRIERFGCFPDLSGREFTATYLLTIFGDENSVPVIEREDLELTDGQGNPADGYKISRAGAGENYSDTMHWRNGVSTPAALQRANLQISPHRRDRSLLGTIGFQPFLDAADGFRFMGFYNPHPTQFGNRRDMFRGVCWKRMVEISHMSLGIFNASMPPLSNG